jgi:hypothetical protein
MYEAAGRQLLVGCWWAAMDSDHLKSALAAMNARLTRDILGLSGLSAEPPTTHHLEDVYDRDRRGSSGRPFRHRNRG